MESYPRAHDVRSEENQWSEETLRQLDLLAAERGKPRAAVHAWPRDDDEEGVNLSSHTAPETADRKRPREQANHAAAQEEDEEVGSGRRKSLSSSLSWEVAAMHAAEDAESARNRSSLGAWGLPEPLVQQYVVVLFVFWLFVWLRVAYITGFPQLQ